MELKDTMSERWIMKKRTRERYECAPELRAAAVDSLQRAIDIVIFGRNNILERENQNCNNPNCNNPLNQHNPKTARWDCFCSPVCCCDGACTQGIMVDPHRACACPQQHDDVCLCQGEGKCDATLKEDRDLLLQFLRAKAFEEEKASLQRHN